MVQGICITQNSKKYYSVEYKLRCEASILSAIKLMNRPHIQLNASKYRISFNLVVHYILLSAYR